MKLWKKQGKSVKIEENRKLVSRTREEIAKDYALKKEMVNYVLLKKQMSLKFQNFGDL